MRMYGTSIVHTHASPLFTPRALPYYSTLGCLPVGLAGSFSLRRFPRRVTLENGEAGGTASKAGTPAPGRYAVFAQLAGCWSQMCPRDCVCVAAKHGELRTGKQQCTFDVELAHVHLYITDDQARFLALRACGNTMPTLIRAGLALSALKSAQ